MTLNRFHEMGKQTRYADSFFNPPCTRIRSKLGYILAMSKKLNSVQPYVVKAWKESTGAHNRKEQPIVAPPSPRGGHYFLSIPLGLCRC